MVLFLFLGISQGSSNVFYKMMRKNLSVRDFLLEENIKEKHQINFDHGSSKDIFIWLEKN